MADQQSADTPQQAHSNLASHIFGRAGDFLPGGGWQIGNE